MTDTHLLTINEVGETLRVSPRTIRRLIDRGEIRPTRVSTRLRISKTEIARYIRAQTNDNQTGTVAREETCLTKEMGFTKEPTHRTGGQRYQTDAAERLAAVLGFGSATTRKGQQR